MRFVGKLESLAAGNDQEVSNRKIPFHQRAPTDSILSSLAYLSKFYLGQGDILAGLVLVYTHWLSEKELLVSDSTIKGCILASVVARKAEKRAFERKFVSMTAVDVIEELGESLKELVGMR